MSTIIFKNVFKNYHLGETIVPALKNINLSIESGEFTVIAGPSGSGKTTLLNLIGCVDLPTRGEVVVAGKVTSSLAEKDLTRLRLLSLGFIFQSFNLISVLNVYDNVEFPLLLNSKISKKQRMERVHHFVEKVGLTQFVKHRPNELSGGQRQRVAIARALVSMPEIVLADEPTANLDSQTGEQIIDLMQQINSTEGTTFLFSTHDENVMKHAQRIIHMKDGQLQSTD